MVTAPHRIGPVYAVDNAGQALLFAGPLRVAVADRYAPDATEVIELPGDLVLDLHSETSVRAHFAGPLDDLAMRLQTDDVEIVGLGPAATLSPPAVSAVPERSGPAWFTHTVPVAKLDYGDPELCDRFVIHISGALTNRLNLRPVDVGEGVRQGQLKFVLPGWELTLVALPGETGAALFTHVIEAVPTERQWNIEELLSSLYHLLGFVAGYEIGIGATCGFVDDDITWVHWSSSRQRPGRPGVRWCSPVEVANALPALATGVGRIEADPYMRHVYRRSLGYLHAASGAEVLDVKIPLACAGLELLAWGVLQDQGWARAELLGMRGIPAAAATRLLLRSMDIPTDIPTHLEHIRARAQAIRSDWGGPEIIFQIRNALIHPPKGALSDFEVPHHDQLWETWLLATWYLELALLHLLGYQGRYWSRLRLGRHENDVEPVPWAPPVGE